MWFLYYWTKNTIGILAKCACGISMFNDPNLPDQSKFCPYNHSPKLSNQEYTQISPSREKDLFHGPTGLCVDQKSITHVLVKFHFFLTISHSLSHDQDSIQD